MLTHKGSSRYGTIVVIIVFIIALLGQFSNKAHAGNNLWGEVGTAQQLVEPVGANAAAAPARPATAPNLNAIKMVSATDGWIVGQSGVIKHYYDGRWLDYSSPTTNYLYGVDLLGGDGWAVGANNTLLHLIGSNWQTAASPAPANTALLDVDIDAAGSGWAIGNVETGQNIYHNYILHLSGGSWSVVSPVAVPSDIFLRQMSCGAANDCWLVGKSSSAYHYSGGTWVAVPLTISYPNDYPMSIYMLSASEGWMGLVTPNNFDPFMLHYSGGTWHTSAPDKKPAAATTMQQPAGGCGPIWYTHSVLAFTSNDFFATEEDGCLPFPLDNHLYHDTTMITTTQTVINAMSGVSGTDFWLVGENSTIYHWIGYLTTCFDYYYDVPAGYFAGAAIFYLSCHGIVSGTGDHIFSPGNPATRIQFAKMISLARGWPLITPAQASYTDVPTGNPLYTYVETAHAHGAINGATQAGCQAAGKVFPCFLPNNNITRAQAAIITQQAFAWPNNTTGGPHFSDVATNNYAYTAIETCYNKGVVNGIGGGLFAPNQNVTRAQIAVILYKALTLP